MQKNLLFAVAFFAVGMVRAYGQLTLDPGDSFSSLVIFSNPPTASGSWMPGYVCVYFDPATVQADDEVRLEVFEHGVGDGLIFSQTFTNATTICGGGGGGFAFWDGNGSLRVTMLSGSATIVRLDGFVSIGPFFCPCSAYAWVTAAGPRVKISRLADSQLRVSWSTNSTTGFRLESTASLRPMNWSEVTHPITTEGDRFVVNVDGGQGFLRLHKPR